MKPLNEPKITNAKTNIAIFASGTGTNAKQIIQHFTAHPSVSVALVVCNKPGAGVINIATDHHIPVLMIEKTRFAETGYVRELQGHLVHFIVLAGFLWKVPDVLIQHYRNKIINIHPALLPKYGGKGMYGAKVHEAVLASGDKTSGITIHYVDEHYDNGDIIFQATCPVMDDDTPATLANRIHQLEHTHYPQIVEETVTKAVQ